jgi:hypothetical protein
MITVACVLRSGGWCSALDVQRLAAGVARHLPLPHRFACLSDIYVPGVECRRLDPTAPPGFWAKLRLFKPGTWPHGSRLLFLDLDTIVVGDLSELASYTGRFACLSDFLRLERAQSGVMAWTVGLEGGLDQEIWEAFGANPGVVGGTRFHGDGDFAAWVLAGREERLQALFPSQIVSFKAHCRRGVPEDARLVCFHGHPRPHEIPGTHPLAVEWRRDG